MVYASKHPSMPLEQAAKSKTYLLEYLIVRFGPYIKLRGKEIKVSLVSILEL